MWWSWTSAETRGVEITADGDIDTCVAVFTGTNLPALTLVHKGWAGCDSRLQRAPPYQICVSEDGGYGGGSFLFKLRPLPPPRERHVCEPSITEHDTCRRAGLQLRRNKE